MSVVIGWDVGGSHLNAAHAEGGRIVAAIQIASPLWLGVSRLDEAFRTARSELGSAAGHAATMTGNCRWPSLRAPRASPPSRL